MVTVIIGRTTTSPSSATGRSTVEPDREDRSLRGVEDGDELLDAEHPEVRDRERPALEIMQLEGPGSGKLDDLRASRCDLDEGEPVGRPDHRDDQPLRRGDREPDVGRREPEDPVCRELDVDVGMPLQGPGRRPARSGR